MGATAPWHTQMDEASVDGFPKSWDGLWGFYKMDASAYQWDSMFWWNRGSSLNFSLCLHRWRKIHKRQSSINYDAMGMDRTATHVIFQLDYDAREITSGIIW